MISMISVNFGVQDIEIQAAVIAIGRCFGAANS
jgi:hypothetical protein